MPRKRPTPVTVIAVLNLVFGGIGLACYLCVGAGILLLVMAFEQAAAQDPKIRDLKEVLDSMSRHVPSLIPFTVGNLIFSLVMTILLVVSGIGLLRMQGWARVLSIFVAVATILEQIAGLVYRFTVLNPGLQAWQREFLAKHPGAVIQENPLGGQLSSAVGEILGIVLQLTYSIVLLVIMFTPTVVAAFRAPEPGYGPLERDLREERDEDQYDRGERWRDEEPPR
jgi:hypothetical protein